MKDVKITAACFVPKENVKFYTAYDGFAVKKYVRAMKKDGKVLDLTRGKRINTVIILSDGTIITVNTQLKVINERMEDANS